MKRLLAIAAILLAILSPAKATPRHGTYTPLVFAYYFLATSTYGNLQANYAQDITDAQAIGIDGFAVAAGSWDATYQSWVAAIFAAAQAASLNADGTKFKLFISAEVGGSLTAADVISMVDTYKGTKPATATGVSDTNYYWFTGRPLLTTSTGQQLTEAFWHTVRNGTSVALYPGFTTPHPPGGAVDSDTPTYAEINADWQTWWKSLLDGLFYFTFDGMAINSNGTQGTLIDSQEAYARVMRESSRAYLGGLSGYYAQNRYSNTFQLAVERFGYEGIDAQWNSVKNVQRPQWVLITSWNDIGETYNTSADPALMPLNGVGVYAWPPQTPHVGFTMYHKWKIAEFKNGYSPITVDELFYAYRTQTAAATPPATSLTASRSGTTLTVSAISSGTIYLGQELTHSGGQETISAFLTGTGGTGTYSTFQSGTLSSRAFASLSITTAFFNLADNVYVSTRLTAPATVRVTSGGNVTDTIVPAGLNHIRVPFTTGTQNIKLIRGVATLIDLTGLSIKSAITYYDQNPTTGYGSSP